MKIVELREKTTDELQVIAQDLQQEIHQKRMDVAMNIAKDHGVIRNKKKDLARVKTVLNEKKRDA
ncbi:MAG: 50S ribosomal protein L29 [Candidatus Moraniibacteriota bacterium]|nr:MAG: 50S ribosomal protein L29 [Candidatus Moranbacteria bacterium]